MGSTRKNIADFVENRDYSKFFYVICMFFVTGKGNLQMHKDIDLANINILISFPRIERPKGYP